MVTFEAFRELALSFPETTESPHFEKTSFRVKNKIFATYDGKCNMACIKLSEFDQFAFASMGGASVYPVGNKWGKQGWTMITLETVDNDLFSQALASAYSRVAPKKLAEMVRSDGSG